MNNVGGALNFNATLDLNEWRRSVEQIRRDLLGLSDTAVKETQSMDSAFRNLSIGVASYLSVNSLKSFVTEIINVRGEFQKTEIAFTTMLGNADQAKVLMGQMVDLAAKTPFGLQDVSSGAKQLLAFQVPANEVVDVLTRMGNIAAGLGVPLSRINLVYGQVKAKGKLAGDDLRQFTEAGIPMVAELAKKFNKTTSEITEMVSAGKIGFKDVQDVLFSLTNEGGMFFNLMEKQSASLSGKIANLGDAWDQMLNKMGEASDGILSNGIEGITYLVDHYQKVLEIIEGLVVTYGSYKAAVIVTSAAQALGNRTIQSEIALLSISEKMKLGRAMVTQRQAEATAREAAAELASTRAKYSALQVEVSSLSVKKQSAIQSALNAAVKSQEARAQLQNARMELAAIQSTGAARQISIAQKRVESAQNAVIATQETASIARKRALAVATEFNTAKQSLENTAKAVGTAQGALAVATETAQTAAKNANSIATARLTLLTSLRTAATRLATQAQALLNATMLNNPIVLLIAGAVALTYAYLKLRDTSTAASIAEKQLNDERQRSSNLLEELKNKTQELTSVINSDTSTKLQQLEAYKAMQKMYPDLLGSMDLETFKKLGSTEAQKKLNAEMDKFSTQNLRNNIETAKKSIEGYTAKIEELNNILKKRNGDSGIYLDQLEIAKKNLEAQKINLAKYNEEYRQRLENEKLSSMSLDEQKKYWEDQVKLINKEISSLEKSNVKKAEALDKVNNIHSLVKSTSIGLINWNINPLLNQLNRAQTEINKINKAQSGASIDKNKAFWEKQKKDAEDLVASMPTSKARSPEWAAAKRKWLEADAALRKYDLSDKQLLKDEKERARERLKLEKGAEKSFLQGSLSRIEQEISLREEALKRSSGDSVQMRYIDKYGKERFSNEVKSVKSIQDELLELREKRAEREKLIELKSFQERIEESERQWNNYYRMAEFYGKETAEAQYKDLFQGSQTYLAYLEKQEQALTELAEKGIISPQQRADLVFIGEKKRSLTGEETPFENWKRDIDNALKSLPSVVDQIDKLNEAEEKMRLKEGKNTSFFLQVQKYVKEQKRNAEQAQKDQYLQFEKDHKTFEQRKTEITKQYEEIRKGIQKSNNSEIEKSRQTEEANKAEAKDISSMSWELFQKTDAYVKAFGDLEKVGPKALKKIREQFKAFLDSEAGKKLGVQDMKALMEAYDKLDQTTKNRNPFEAIGIAIDKYKKKKEELNRIEKESGKGSVKYNEKLDETKASFSEIVEVSGEAVNGSLEFASSLGEAFGVLSQEAQKALKDVQKLFEGIVNIVSGYGKNWGQFASGIVQIVSTLSNIISGDNKKEAEIKGWQRDIENLKFLYEQLNKEIEKTAGEASLKKYNELITNLKKQQALLNEMRTKESDKKNPDVDKVNSYSDQIRQISVQIEELVDAFKQTVTTIEFKELSKKLADALTNAFAQGEDAARSFDKVVDEVMKNAVVNALRVKYIEPVAQEMVDKLYSSMGFGNSSTSSVQNEIAKVESNLKELEEKIKTAGLQEKIFLENVQKEQLEKLKLLQQKLSEIYANGSFDGLTPEEIKEIKDYKNDPRLKELMEALKGIDKIFDTTIEGAQGLKGDIKGITEKTAGALEGQINAMRIMQAEALKRSKDNLEVMRSQLLVQSQIEINTRPLKGIYDEIKSMNSKIKNGLAGIP